jgi:hypothetical protein
MNNWKIGTRIGAGFGAVILIAVALGVFAYTRVGVIHESSTDISENSLPSVYVIGEMQANTQAFYGLLLRHVVTNDKGEMARIGMQIETSRAHTGELIARYEKLISNDKDKELFQAIKDARTDFKKEADEVIKLSEIGTAESKKQALEMAIKLKPTHDRYVAATVAEVEFNQGLAAESSKVVKNSVRSHSHFHSSHRYRAVYCRQHHETVARVDN